MKKSFFITLEGSDGCGKSTQSRLLKTRLLENGFQVVHTREPGGTSFAEHLRRIILNPKHKISPLAELLLYEASRAQHTDEVILPALKKDQIVLCERYADATLAYQGYGRGLDLPMIEKLNRIATSNLEPNLTIFLDIGVGKSLNRAKKQKHGGDRLEQEANSFHHRVRRGYLEIAKENPKRIKIVQANGTIAEVHSKIWEKVWKKVGRCAPHLS